jgi:hypothetical protein
MHVDRMRFHINYQPPYSLVQERGSESCPEIHPGRTNVVGKGG